MISLLPLALAESRAPLFGNQWIALAVILAGVVVLMTTVSWVGRWLAATHPEPLRTPLAPATAGAAPPAVPVDPAIVPPEILAVIAASIAATLGARARVAAVRPATLPNVEMLMQQWSLEGRRQIYSSHQIR
jgi:hypothetical protein